MGISQSSSSPEIVDTPETIDTETETVLNVRKCSLASQVSRKQYLNPKTADVHFQCGDERIPAHKSILSSASDVFEAMFYGPNAKDGDKYLPDTSPQAFKYFLQFFYLDNINFGHDYIDEVIGLTHEYQMTECVEMCGNYWADHLNIDNLCNAYNYAIFYNIVGLRQCCERKISAFEPNVFEMTEFLNCHHNVLDCILQLDSLVCPEKFILKFCLDWAREACIRDGLNSEISDNLRYYLGDSLYKIRYGSMARNEFNELVGEAVNLFADPDDNEDVMKLLAGEHDLKNDWFNVNPRSTNIFQWNEEQNISCNVSSLNYYTGDIDGNNCDVLIKSTGVLLLGGFYCKSIFERGIEVKITITEEPDCNQSVRNLAEVETELSTGRETFIDFSENTIIIRIEHIYRIHFQLSKYTDLYPFVHEQETFYLPNGTCICLNPKNTGKLPYSIIQSFCFNTIAISPGKYEYVQ